MKILLCEDDLRLKQQIVKLLEKEGYEVAACSTIAQLYAWVDGFADLLLLDVHLKDGCVYDVIRMIRKENPVPVLFLSADVEESVILEGYSLDCLDYIEKPVRPNVLLAKIQAAARREGLLEPVILKGKWVYHQQNGQLGMLDETGNEHPAASFQGGTARAFELLFRHTPNPVSKGVLCSCFSWSSNDQTMRVRLSELRKRLPEGIRIQSIREKGYCLLTDTGINE